MRKISYASAIGSLMYAMICTRSNIAHAVGVVNRYPSNPGKELLSDFSSISRELSNCVCVWAMARPC